MKPISSLFCPYCHGPCQPSGLHCQSCQVEIRATFSPNEFAYLSAEDLHFLRIFLKCEGRIRDMEAPLGLSYPTIRSRLTALKEKVLSPEPLPIASPPKPGNTAKEALEGLESGDLSFAETLNRLKKRKKENR